VVAEYEALAALLKTNYQQKKSKPWMNSASICCVTKEVGLLVMDFKFHWLLNDRDVQDQVRIHVLNILAAAALKDDVILVLHQDRKDHVLMNYAYEIDRISVEEQRSLALF
ncbi:hypothetical protein ILUMI_19136, partial [Ignelater luminosus]